MSTTVDKVEKGRPAASTPASPLARVTTHLTGPLVGLVLLSVIMSVLSPVFLKPSNLINILEQVSYIGIMAVGATLVIILGGIDLAVSAILGLSFMIVAVVYRDLGLPFWLAILVGLALGALVGAINGTLIAYGKIQPFIATLASMFAATGLALYVTNGTPVLGFPNWFQDLAQLRLFSVPLQVYLMLVVFILATLWLKYRPSGRALFAIGSNAEVARLSGLPVKAIQMRVYATAGFLAAVSGLVVGARLNAAQPTAGNSTDLLNVIAAVVIGGARLSGGIGTMSGTFVGLLIIGVVNNGLTLLNVSPNLQPVVIGGVIILAVAGDGRSRGAITSRFRNRRREDVKAAA